MNTENKEQPLTLDRLRVAVGNHSAIRCNRKLQPAGGAGDKVFPPTYAGGKYAVEERVVFENGSSVRLPCVLLDSVQSQANRIEEALLDATRAGAIPVPLVEVDFAAVNLPEVGVITSLEAPHRLADAILRDSKNGEVDFRKSDAGGILDNASAKDAIGLFGLCPTALLMGLWDSSGPRGGLGTKFQRCIVSEIVGVDIQEGVRPSSRLDPLGIVLNAGPLYTKADGSWTLNPEEAKVENGKPVQLGKSGKPSEAIHGNIRPAFDGNHGGVTMRHALQTVVISLPALRRLRFPLDGSSNGEADIAARTVLAALGLCGAVLSIERGCDLRSRCLLIPEPGQSGWELVHGNGDVEPFSIDADGACALLNSAVKAAEQAGLPWRREPLRLTPSPELAELVRKSRTLAMQSTEATEGD